MFPGCFIGIVARIRIEHGLIEALIDAHGTREALALHVSVEVAGESPGDHHALYLAVVVEDLFLDIALFVDGIAPSVALLDG